MWGSHADTDTASAPHPTAQATAPPDLALRHAAAHSHGAFVPRGPWDRADYRGQRWRQATVSDPARFILAP